MSQEVGITNQFPYLRDLQQTGFVSRETSFAHSYIAALAIESDMPVCALTIAGKLFQHVKVSVGTDLVLVHRDHAFCSHTMCQDDVMVVEDATKDVRFQDNPYVIDGPRTRFYAGAPLRTLEGQKWGVICLMDDKPRTLTAKVRSRLLDAASAIRAELRFDEQEPPLSQLNVEELLHLIRSETKFTTKNRTIQLISALYNRLDYLH